jgi:AsmA protein
MKIIFKIISILLIITIVIFSLLLIFANPILERVKPHILSSISTSIGAEVQVDAIKSSIFPSPGFSLQGLKVENKEGDDLKVSEVILEVSLMPLFSRRVEIAKVGVRGVRVPIRKLENEDIEVAGINISKKDESSDLNKNEKSQYRFF